MIEFPARPAEEQSTTALVGLVQYRDKIGTIRETGFCWEYDGNAQEFVMPERQDEYNYED